LELLLTGCAGLVFLGLEILVALAVACLVFRTAPVPPPVLLMFVIFLEAMLSSF